MATEPTPYISRNPGDLITAGDWNGVQVDIKKDIDQRIGKAIGDITKVPKAGDAETLGSKSADQLTQEIIQKALEELPLRTGYRRTFNRLTVGKEKEIKHGLGGFPLVDVYQLDYFEVVCAKGETKEDQRTQWVNFYLYNTSERRLRKPESSATPPFVDIEPPDAQQFKVLFSDMLNLYSVRYTDDTTVDDLETDFWKAFFAYPLNDEFDPDQYCHSPWFEKCCGERRTVKNFKDRGDWDDIWFKMVPRKTVNYPPAVGAPGIQPAPTQIQVAHANFDTLVVKLLAKPVYEILPAGQPPLPGVSENELKIMLLLKV